MILFVILGALALALPLKEKIVLGLDLQGGMHLVLEVQVEKAVEATLERMADDIKRALEDEDVEVDRVFERIEENEIHVVLVDTINLDDLEKVLNNYPALEKKQVIGEGIETVYRISDDEIEWIQENSVQQALEIIRNRIDQYGVSEPTIQVQGERRILVQLPGIECPKCAVDLIGQTARLEFRLIDETMGVQTAMKTGVPEGDEILYQRNENKDGGKGEPFLVKKRAALTGDTLTAAEVRYDSQYNEPYVAITFNSIGADIFRQITRENIKKRLAIVLDGNVYSAPVIQDEIAGGRAQITGSFTTEEARDLAIILRAGALPAPVTMLENRTVGPSLGRDSIEKGVKSIIIGTALVLVFILVYYRMSGLVANTALFLNIIILMGALAYFGASLTLPGIAGIILTVGMAIDANVLVFERIREEQRAGRTPISAVDAGYRRALTTIIDANVTTLIAAVLLLIFGSGPVKGFGVTLALGLLTSMFTAIWVTRLMVVVWLRRAKPKVLPI